MRRLFLLAGMLAACSADSGETAGAPRMPAGAPRMLDAYDYDWTTPSEEEGIVPYPVPADTGPVRMREGANSWRFGKAGTDHDTGEVEKGTTSMLMGWGLRPSLHYQDGTCTEPDCGTNPDHCSLFGLACDNSWHFQTRTLNIDGERRFRQESTGACAPGSKSWEPCIMPKMRGNRTIKWRLDMNTCPSGPDWTTERTALLNGWASARAMTGRVNLGISVTWQETTGNDWELIIACRQYAPGVLQGQWTPRDSFIEMRYAAAGYHYRDACDTSGTPGYHPSRPWVGDQYPDMIYEVDRNEIVVDMWQMKRDNDCTANATRIMYSYHNLLMHELGHMFGLQHDLDTNADFNLMRPDTTCAEDTSRKKNFHPFYRNAITSIDTSTNSSHLTVWDDDIACLKPAEY